MATDECRVRLLRNAGGVPYALRQGFPTFEMDYSGAKGKEEYLISRDDMTAFYLVSMPPPVVFGNNIVVFTPRRMPGTVNLTTRKLSFRPHAQDLPQDPFGVDPPGYNNPYMVVSIDYETDKLSSGEVDPNDPETFLELSFDTGAEFLKVPASKHNFVSVENAEDQGADGSAGSGNTGSESQSGLPARITVEETNIDAEVPITIIVPTTNYNLNWKLALNPNFALFRSLIGRVNRFTDPLFDNAPPETILFLGFSGRRTYLWDGEGSPTVTPWNLTFKFRGKHVEDSSGQVFGWQHIYRSSRGGFYKVRRANLSYIYNSTSTWSQMFRASGLL